MFGNPAQLLEQIEGVVVTYVFAAVSTFVIIKVLIYFIELRVKPEVEYQGLDVSQHGEEAYNDTFTTGEFVPVMGTGEEPFPHAKSH